MSRSSEVSHSDIEDVVHVVLCLRVGSFGFTNEIQRKLLFGLIVTFPLAWIVACGRLDYQTKGEFFGYGGVVARRRFHELNAFDFPVRTDVRPKHGTAINKILPAPAHSGVGKVTLALPSSYDDGPSQDYY
ncbi:hypothetical protein BJ138DRAFT_1121030 [Hygrophoropsis aurantiaca]|uniref:Uncharacterized protein n=1 Tax=Hygrophoropsis aurantiaca TaxID=72124 RepID=A0ACB7ZQ78_9AGAM|nr:hypothetical protein BJ138DRAFT_1121030 [Hygrophoropsis aurantiaca]